MAMQPQIDSQAQDLVSIHRQYKFFYQVLGGTLLILFGVWIGSILFRRDGGYTTNLYTEVLSIGVTVFVLDALARRREERLQTLQRKRDLVSRVGSRLNSVALAALDELHRFGWLSDGTLKGANLIDANLSGANTAMEMSKYGREAIDLEGAVLAFSRMDGAALIGAKLHRAELFGAYMSKAHFPFADFSGANLTRADLSRSELTMADFKGARLWDADLQGADLWGARFDVTTILPDGSTWTKDTDMNRFTDPAHPQFWRSDNIESAAHRNIVESNEDAINKDTSAAIP